MNVLEENLPFLFERALEGNIPVLRKSLLDLSNNTEIQENGELNSIISDLQNLVNRQARVGMRSSSGLRNREESPELYTILNEPHLKNPIVLDEQSENEIRKFGQTYERRADLQKYGLGQLNTLFLYGPPGVGKTSLVTFISQMTHLPLMTVNLSNLISRYLGNTGKNIAEIIHIAKSRPLILFFDEFDALARSRSLENESGELRRIVNVLLTEIEDWNKDGILIAATNFEEAIDPAIIRRFSTKIGLKFPTLKERKELWNIFIGETNVNEDPANLVDFLAENSEGSSPSEIKDLAFSSIRDSVLNGTKLSENLIINFINSQLFKESLLADVRSLVINVYTLLPGFSQRKIAELTGISRSKVQRIISEYMNSQEE